MTPASRDPYALVSAADYEARLGPDGEDELAALAAIMGKVYAARRPRRMAVLGVGTGQGLEHVDLARTRRVLGVDVNLSLLGTVRQRFLRLGPRLQLVCAEPGRSDLGRGRLDLVHVARGLERLETRRVAPRLAAALAPGGACSVVLRLGDAEDPMLGGVQGLREGFAEAGLAERRAFVVPLRTGRRLFVALYEKPPAPARTA